MLLVAVFVDTSATVKVIVCLPKPSRVPAAGVCVIPTLPHESDATTSPVRSGSRARQLVPMPMLRSAGLAVIRGGVVSKTTTGTRTSVVRWFSSVALSNISEAPIARKLPASGDCRMVNGLQSVTTTWVVRSGTLARQLVPATRARFAGAPRTTGEFVSTTVTR